MSKQRRKGFQAERELARKLWQHGFAVLRAPASGSGARKLYYPDILAIYKGKIFVIEVKYRSSTNNIYINKEKLGKLRDFAQRAKAEIILAIKIKNKGWFITPLQECIETPNGCKVMLKEDNIISFNEFVNNVINENIDKYIGRKD